MAVERANPLPPNAVYWVDVSPEDNALFTAWLNANRQGVKVRKTKHDASNGWDWILFETVAPLVWWEGPGFPTIAVDGIKTNESDVKQIPHVESASEMLGGLFGSGSWLPLKTKIVIGVAAVATGAAYVAKKIWLDPWLPKKD